MSRQPPASGDRHPVRRAVGLSRRDFLRVGAASLAGLALPGPRSIGPHLWDATEGQLGRVLVDGAQMRAGASAESPQVDMLAFDEIVHVKRAVVGQGWLSYNRVWYEIPDLGFIHSAFVQPVRDQPQAPLHSVTPRGLLTEVSVPFVDAFAEPDDDSEWMFRLYYETTHWIVGAEKDGAGQWWYRIHDDRVGVHYFAPGSAFRLVQPAELTPISPTVPAADKHIEVSLTEQWIKCYEGLRQVFTAKVSTGMALPDGSYFTPEGEFDTFRKRASRHMMAGDRITGYDLPGVPWVSYFTTEGLAFHGTYWHNEFGAPRSHGCVNLASASAKWVFRWTMPVVPLEKIDLWSDGGTKVVVTR
jgi:L,D-transpeptidase catalytic domain